MRKVLLTCLLLPLAASALEELHCTRHDAQVVCDASNGRIEGWVAVDGSVVLRRAEGAALEGRIRGQRLVLRGPDHPLTCWITADGVRWHCRR